MTKRMMVEMEGGVQRAERLSVVQRYVPGG